MTNPTEETKGTNPGFPSGTNRQTIPNHSGKGHEASGSFIRFRKSYLAETTSGLSLSPQARRKELSRDFEVFSFYPVGKSSRKTAQCCLENLCVRALERRTTINELSEHFHANHQKLYESQKRSFIRRTTLTKEQTLRIIIPSNVR
jgi:hypothetical protein